MPNQKEKIENWIKDESFKIVYSDPKTIERATSQLLEIFKSEKEKLLERIGLKDKGSTIEIPVSKENLLDEGELYNMRTQKETSFKQGYNQALVDFRELPSLKGMWYAGFSAGKKIILEKLKEEIKNEIPR